VIGRGAVTRDGRSRCRGVACRRVPCPVGDGGRRCGSWRCPGRGAG